MSRLVDMLRLPDEEYSVIELEKLKNEIKMIKTAWRGAAKQTQVCPYVILT
uniref:Uncharacterized protein n=1 Tax=Solanum tuberosum TaxID=4113 RepID=M1BZX0_SOLTU